MEINNHHISQIQSLLHDELSLIERTKLLSDIENNEELKQEYLLQKELHKAFEEMGKQQLKKYLSKNHKRFKRFVFFKKYFLIISAILFIAAISYIGYHFIKKTEHAEHVKTTTTTPKSDVKKEIPSSIQEKEEKTIEVTPKVTSTPKKTSTFETKTISHKTLIPFHKKNVFLKNEELIFHGFNEQDLQSIQLVKWNKKYYLKNDKEIYSITKKIFKPETDVRIIQALKIIKKSDQFMNAKLLLLERKISTQTKVLKIESVTQIIEQNDTITIDLKNNKKNIKSMNLNDTTFLFVNNEAFRLDGNKYKAIRKIPKEVVRTKIPIYIQDIEMIQHFNEL